MTVKDNGIGVLSNSTAKRTDVLELATLVPLRRAGFMAPVREAPGYPDRRNARKLSSRGQTRYTRNETFLPEPKFVIYLASVAAETRKQHRAISRTDKR